MMQRTLERGSLKLVEEPGKQPPKKPLEVDEACYSLDESLENEETKCLSPSSETLYVHFPRKSKAETTSDGHLNQEDGDRSGNIFQGVSFRSQECNTEPCGDAWQIGTCDDHFRNYISHGALEPERRVLTLTMYNRVRTGPSGSFPSEDYEPETQIYSTCFTQSSSSLLPDFDRLLSLDPDGVEIQQESADDLRQTCQYMIQEGHDYNEIFAELKRMGSDDPLEGFSDEPPDVTFDGLDEDASWTEEDCTRIVEQIRVGALCSDSSCKDLRCQGGKQMIANIEIDLENERIGGLDTRRLLAAISRHSTVCDDSSCSVPWCLFFTRCREQEIEEQCASLQRHYRNMKFAEDFEEIDIDISEQSEFIQLDQNVVWPCIEHKRLQNMDPRAESSLSSPSVPKNGIDFLVNGHFGKYAQLGLTALSTTLPSISLNIIQFVSYENCSELWSGLVGLSHDNIVRHLWACVDVNCVTICRDQYCMEGESLESLVKKVNPRRIEVTTAVGYMAGLVAATRYLRERGISFLNWSASGIQMNYCYTLAMLSDFSFAVTSSMMEEDEEMVDIVVSSLPPYILPPESFSDDDSVGRIGEWTEVWGIGCIIYYVSCGQPVHHNLRHKPLETVQQMVKVFSPRDHLKLVKIPVMAGLLSHIFTEEENRMDLLHLADNLQQLMTAKT